ncbi:hypothetical protein BKA63DRAFT_543623 [Paraphoma chrysanthemicola]|nr:hypothetical protein BKA63DRAFT_543623 [Paraphoma chrysanthemicola]
MRLLQLQDDGEFSLTEYVGSSIPPYAILSHTWGFDNDEVILKDLVKGKGKTKKGYRKLIFCGKQAANDGLRHFWIDSCCINKDSSAELSEAINSMFRWYHEAVKCYAYLSDVSTISCAGGSVTFQESRWFTRGWTLQELLAPKCVEFFSAEGDQLGSRISRVQEIANITGISTVALLGRAMSHFSVEERMAWANRRETTREEDIVYSLFGLFDVHMPLIYGEGKEKALRRLRKEIREVSGNIAASLPRNTQNHSLTRDTTPTYCIPFLKNRYFVGRRDELDVLKKRLMVDRDCQKMSIVGLGGTGKTQVALQFAYMVKETWPEYSIFWVPALSMESFEQACADIARALHIPLGAGQEEDAKELVKHRLSVGRVGRWLLVLDNADDADILFGTGQLKGIIDYLPQSEEGVTVYTTRTLEVAVSLTRGDVMELVAMNRLDAAEFLEKSLIRKDLLDNGAATTELLDELTCLPLAIAQAAAYLNINRMSIAKYLRLLRSTEQDIVGLMSREFRDDTRYKGSANAVATTWVVSFSQVQARNVAATDLLAFMSCIEWKAIPRSLLPSVESEERMEDAMGTLCMYSFLTKRETSRQEEREEAETEAEGEEEWYDMHRLVHLATRIWISKYSNAAKVTEKAVRHTVSVFPSDDYANRAVWRAYLPHALRLLESMLDSDGEKKSELCLLVGQCLQVDGRIREAVKWLEECCRLRGRLDEEDSNWLASQHALAVAYEADGQVKKAVELMEHVVAVHKKVLAEEHPDRLTSQHVKKAVELIEHIVAVRKKVLAEEHPDRLASQHMLAMAYHADGQVKKAVELMEHVVAVEKKMLVEEHPSRLASQHVLAMAYQADGQVKKAVELMEHVVAMRKKVLAEEHSDRLTSQHELARAYQADGQVKKAVELMEHVVAVKARILRDNHPSRLVSIRVLEDMYIQLQ